MAPVGKGILPKLLKPAVMTTRRSRQTPAARIASNIDNFPQSFNPR